MEIYLVRHTTPDIEKGICYGQSDIGLTDTFQSEFETLRKELPEDLSAYKIYSSPLKRCASLAEQLNANLITDERLKELNFGDWELKAWNDIPEKEINPWMKDFVNVKTTNGESYTELSNRVLDFFKSVTLDSKNTIVVSHAGAIRAFLADVLHIDLKDSFNIKINYGDCFHLRYENNAFQLITEINL